ncbi:MAG TPA: glycine cleavage system protein H [Anaerolineales bacterium]|nr:glycine cleavage system protein H [Anaerolineales bacterium]
MSNQTNSYEIPADRAYDREHHMWAQLDAANGNVLVGIDTLGLASLGDLAYVTLKEVGVQVKRGESMGTLEAAKMTGDLIAPVSGTIVTRNDATVSNPGLVNESPYKDGWMIVIQPSDWENESMQLVSGDGLPAWVDAEVARYKNQGWID